MPAEGQRVSIAMATYNGAAYIIDQLESFASQTSLPDEIIISDDGSTDGTLALVHDWHTRHPSLNLRILDGRGPGHFVKNFVRALRATSGELVFLSDQDDVWYPDKIATMARIMARNSGTMVAIHDVDITDGHLVPTGQQMISRLRGMGDPMHLHTSGMATVVRRAFLLTCIEVPESFTHDNWIHHCARGLDAKQLVETSLGYYRRHGGALTVEMIQNAPAARSAFHNRLAHARTVARRDRDGRDLATVLAQSRETLDWMSASRVALMEMGIEPGRITLFEERQRMRANMAGRRLEIRRLGRLQRVPGIVGLWKDGGYQYFNGSAAALKDFLI